jgi:tRNA-Thr(GGU) m(6)t(6)A37 methyltransferase TsaA
MRWLRRLLDALRALFGMRIPPIPREPAVFRPIGVVRNNVRERYEGWESVRSDIIIRDDLLDALDGIDAYSHLIVLFHIDRVPEAERTSGRIHPRGDQSLPLQGVLATRSQLRPNAIGMTVVPLLRRRKNILRVRGLDAIDGTPVLDIKPYISFYDSIPDATLPDWATRR